MAEVVKPRTQLLYTWGSEELVAAMTDVIYRAYTLEKAFEKVKNNPDVVRRRITNFLRDGHHSVFEFAGASWLIEGSRALTHELIRHRLASYWQESQRYVDYSKGQLRYVAPPGVLEKATQFLETDTKSYMELRKSLEPEDARYILPNAMASRIWVQMNAREFFLTFIPLRTGLGAFHEIRLIAWLMFDSLIDKFPIISKWVWDNLPKLHPDYCRNIDKLKEKYGSEDCRIVSIKNAFETWQLETPQKLTKLMS